MTAAETPVLETPLAASHVGLGARMVPFAGYLMPVQYPTGILAEHQWTRAHAGLFDVSHMGQAALIGPDHATTAKALEALIPAAVVELGEGRQRYSQLLADDGGILDDLMFAREAGADGRILLVVNAACKAADYAHIAARLPEGVRLEIFEDRALLALQGPEAEAVIESLGGAVSGLRFMDVASIVIAGVPVHVSRSGYTGEDGFEISVANDDVTRLWDLLLEDARVKPIGLGARDSLRLEGGLCLYGHDIDTTTSPIEGGLAWSIQKRRRVEGGFPGWARIARELEEGPTRIRVGLLIDRGALLDEAAHRQAVALDHAGGARDRLDAEGLLERAGGVGELLLVLVGGGQHHDEEGHQQRHQIGEGDDPGSAVPAAAAVSLLLRHGRSPRLRCLRPLPGRRRDACWAGRRSACRGSPPGSCSRGSSSRRR